MQKSSKIILVEDDKDLREMYKTKLEIKGCKILTAIDGISALNLIGSTKPDLILLDILIPKKDGFEVLRNIRNSKDQILRSIPVIVISNLASKEDRYEAEKLGISGYLIKSNVSLAQVVEAVNKTLEARKQ